MMFEMYKTKPYICRALYIAGENNVFTTQFYDETTVLCICSLDLLDSAELSSVFAEHSSFICSMISIWFSLNKTQPFIGCYFELSIQPKRWHEECFCLDIFVKLSSTQLYIYSTFKMQVQPKALYKAKAKLKRNKRGNKTHSPNIELWHFLQMWKHLDIIHSKYYFGYWYFS